MCKSHHFLQVCLATSIFHLSSKLFLIHRCIDPDEDRVALILGGYPHSYADAFLNVEVYTTYNDKCKITIKLIPIDSFSNAVDSNGGSPKVVTSHRVCTEHTIPDLPWRLREASAAYLDGSIHLCGGRNYDKGDDKIRREQEKLNKLDLNV